MKAAVLCEKDEGLVAESVDVIGKSKGVWEGCQAASLAALAAAAALYPHDVARKVFASISTVKLQPHSTSLRWLAAAAIRAGAAGTRPVLPCGRAACKGDLNGLPGPCGTLAFLPFL